MTVEYGRRKFLIKAGGALGIPGALAIGAKFLAGCAPYPITDARQLPPAVKPTATPDLSEEKGICPCDAEIKRHQQGVITAIAEQCIQEGIITGYVNLNPPHVEVISKRTGERVLHINNVEIGDKIRVKGPCGPEGRR